MIDSMATSFRSKEELAPRYYDNSAGLGQWNDSTAGQGRSALFFDPLDLDVEAVTNVAAMTAAAREQLAGFLCRLGFHAPFLAGRHDNGRVEHFQLRPALNSLDTCKHWP